MGGINCPPGQGPARERPDWINLQAQACRLIFNSIARFFDGHTAIEYAILGDEGGIAHARDYFSEASRLVDAAVVPLAQMRSLGEDRATMWSPEALREKLQAIVGVLDKAPSSGEELQVFLWKHQEAFDRATEAVQSMISEMANAASVGVVGVRTPALTA